MTATFYRRPELTIVSASTFTDADLAAFPISGICEPGLPITLSGIGLVTSPQTLECPDGAYSYQVQFTAGATKILLVQQTRIVDGLSFVGTASKYLLKTTNP